MKEMREPAVSGLCHAVKGKLNFFHFLLITFPVRNLIYLFSIMSIFLASFHFEMMDGARIENI